MKKHELLVPVGNYEALVAAINNGADAVYLGGQKFGARAYADNFSLDKLEEAIKLCHLYGVKIYVTVNTLVFDDEFKEALDYLKKIHAMGVDAVIMQDVGLINVTHQTLPNLEIHASTQMHNHSKESLKFLKNFGVTRVVFAREMPLDYMKEIETDLEKEVFIHGSLCISYSGQCLFSSCILNRSGNRGQCAGMCRLAYQLYEDDKVVPTQGNYLLSPKDLCSINSFKELLDSDIVSFKIEGRMKSPLYVALVTRIYKNLIMQYENGEELKVNNEDLEMLKAVFNRKYTKGFLFNDYDIMNYEAPNHMGIHLGNVIEVDSKKIKIRLDRGLKQFESVRFKETNKGITVNFIYDQNDNLINSAKKGDVVYFDNFINLKHLDEVLLTSPVLDEPEEIVKKIPVTITCEAYLNKEIKLIVKDNANKLIVRGDVVQSSKTSPVSSDRIKAALSKCGNTPFEVQDIIVEGDENIFISIGSLNQLRRDALNKLKEIRENHKKEYLEKEYLRKAITGNEYGSVINVSVRTEDQIKACKELGLKNIIINDLKLMKPGYIFKIPRDNMEHKYDYEELLVTDYASLDKYPNSIADYHLNVTNHHSFDYLAPKTKSVMLSVEMTLSQIQNLLDNYKTKINAEVLVYGRIELMLLKHCPLNNLVNKDKVCSVCQNGHKYFLKDRNSAYYPIVNNPVTHSTTILHHDNRNWIGDIPKLTSYGVNSFRVELYDEDYNTTKEILSEIIDKVFTH